MKRQYSLDVLRIVATILIVLHHFQQITGAYFDGGINFYGGKFSYGIVVEFFFVLSGLLAHRYIEQIPSGTAFPQFYLSKAKRLLPLVLISSVAYEGLMLLYNRVCQTSWPLGNDITVWGTILNALGLQAGWVFENPAVNNPTWYVSVLLLCYVVFYLLVYISKHKNIADTYLYAGMVFLGVGVYSHNLQLPFLNEYSSRGFYAFFFGLLLARALYGKALCGTTPGDSTLSDSSALADRLNTKWFIYSLLFVLAVTYGLLNHYAYFHDGILYFMTFVYYPALIILFLSAPVTRLFRHRIWGTLGTITYDVYIWHLPLLLLMYIILELLPVSVNVRSVGTMLIFTAIAWGMGTLSYYLLEKPIQRVTKMRK